jgi:hypothetical protein
VAWESAFGSLSRSPAWRPNSEEMIYEHTRIQGNIYRLNLK